MNRLPTKIPKNLLLRRPQAARIHQTSSSIVAAAPFSTCRFNRLHDKGQDQAPPAYSDVQTWDEQAPTASQQSTSLEGDFADEAPYISREMSKDRLTKEFPSDRPETKEPKAYYYKRNKKFESEWHPNSQSSDYEPPSSQ